MYGFEAILALSNEDPTDGQTYLSMRTPVSIAIHDTFNEESVHLVDQNLQCFIGRFVKVMTEKQDAIVAYVFE